MKTAQLMQNLKEKVTLGIITNGPAQHQWDKVNALGVTEWIPVGHVFISGALGVAKPDKRIFSRAAERMGDFAARDLLCRRFF